MNTLNIKLRIAVFDDIPAIVEMYMQTVRAVNSKDYAPEQIAVWADGARNYPRWENAVWDQYFVLAEIENTPLPDSQGKSHPANAERQKAPEGNIHLAGFSSIAKDGYLDFMYVSKNCQRCGVATALLNEIERKAFEQKNVQIYSHVSKTAKGFFEKMGYKHKEDLRDLYKGVLFINALMVKKLTV